ncbi:hypothetical protein NW762_014612 [Fusarium torreyae]|uniref:Xylanolytic transcriptional activator regulatory domain-containing protein n=1 Tax=Fusarium torreyae TaxID=1237075 RepID=A0A9W8V7K6_9HYPO|nr:hypothetical protein NW762_014612 [Fusarium torreyae]
MSINRLSSRDGGDSGSSLTRMVDNSSSQYPRSVSVTTVPDSPKMPSAQSPSFYGATSHPHVTSPGEESHSSVCDELDGVNIDLDPASPQLRDHLLQSFFKYQTLWVDIVHKDTFQKHQAAQVSSWWYSTFLENAMLACATRLSTSRSVRAVGSKYCELAKTETSNAMSDPTPANLQGFLLLSEYEVTRGNDRPGWMFCGVACRMLSDLGLHELASTVGSAKATRVPNNESGLAYALLSACIVYEGVWTLYLGRPSCIPKSILSVAASRCQANRESDAPWLNAWVGLCVPMAEISQVLNDKSIADSQRIALLPQLISDMEEWSEKLPPGLAYKENSLTGMDPAGYGLHTQYCKVQILVRRALARKIKAGKRRHSEISVDEDTRGSSDDSQAMIYQYALRTARLVVTYREAFGLEKIPSIMLDNAVVAATALIQHADSEYTSDSTQKTAVWLRQLLKSLELVQPHFPIVGRMLESLKNISGHDPAPGVVAPAASSVTAPASEPRVNPRLSTDIVPVSSFLENIPNLSNFPNPDTAWENFDLDRALEDFSAGRFGDPTLSIVVGTI